MAMNPNCKPTSSSVFSMNSSMAEVVCIHFKLLWAKPFASFIIWRTIEWLFQQGITKLQLFHEFLQNQVSNRISNFLKWCYALCKSFLAGHAETWITKNGWAMCEKSGFKVSHSNLFLLDASCLAWFNGYGCRIMHVGCLLIIMICSLLIAGKIVLEQVWWWNIVCARFMICGVF